MKLGKPISSTGSVLLFPSTLGRDHPGIYQEICKTLAKFSYLFRYPHGHFVKALGTAGDKATENEVLLLEHDVPHHSFSQAVLDCLPKTPFCISEEEIKVNTTVQAAIYFLIELFYASLGRNEKIFANWMFAVWIRKFKFS